MAMHKSRSKQPRGHSAIGHPGHSNVDPTPTKLSNQQQLRVGGTNRPQGKNSTARRGDRRDMQPQK